MSAPTEDSQVDAWPRSFLALSPDAGTRKQLASLPSLTGVQPTHVDDLHLTLAFIGAISDAQRQALANALPTLATQAKQIPQLGPTGFETWPVPEKPRVWVAAYALPDALRLLVAQVHAVLTDAGLPVDGRPFRPHITLARFSRGATAAAPSSARLEFPARVESIGLYCRTATRDGPRYMTVASVPLT
jgi:2'-5' RNA ligase